MIPGINMSPRDARFVAFLFIALLFLAAVNLGLLIPIYTGLLVYASVMHLSVHLVRSGNITPRGKWLAVGLMVALVVALLSGAGLAVHLILRNGAGLNDLLLRMGDILASASAWLPAWASNAIPQQGDLLATLAGWLKTHAAELGTIGLGALKGIGYALVGLLLGSMVAIKDATRDRPLGPVSTRLLEQVSALRESFWRVATAQLKISAVNTTLTAIYLMVVLPLFGVHLPFTKTLVSLTFFIGLLPIVGNLLSNSAITIISVSISFQVALASLGFLILVHKLEYFVNARIVGTQINARAWEILLSMLVMERLFGPAGVVAAPVFYAWLKAEWHEWDGVAPIPGAAEPQSRRGWIKSPKPRQKSSTPQ